MKKAQIAMAAAMALGTTFTAQAAPQIHHKKLKTVAAGVAGYLAAKHATHHGFIHRHPVLSGIAAGAAAHHYMKHHH